MAEELHVIRLRDDFYLDGFFKILIALTTILVAIATLIGISLYLYIAKPPPISFATDNEWRVLPPVPLDQPYLPSADLIQWVAQVVPSTFYFDFINYTKQLKGTTQYFTENGWSKYLEYVNTYANYNSVQDGKLFVSAIPAGAPFIVNQGLLQGRYGWWIQMPINISSISGIKGGKNTEPVVAQVLVVRVPTLNNIYGIGIENLIMTKGGGDQVRING